MPESQAAFPHSESTFVHHEKYLSLERLAPYLAQARDDRWVAIHLYQRNVELSEALYGVIHGLEIPLRNAVHNVLTESLGGLDWYEKFEFLESEREAIDKAKEVIAERLAGITPGRVVAELTFSFWVRLAAHQYEDSLWFRHLHRIFPIKLRRRQVHDRLIKINTLRNRIAHHKRILYKRDLEQDYHDLLETVSWLSPQISAWIEQTNCFRERFAKRIPKETRGRFNQLRNFC